MKLYEIDIKSLWWIAAADEMEAMDFFRDEMVVLEVSDSDMDDAMKKLTISELLQDEAEIIDVGEFSIYDSLWSMFESSNGPGLIHSDFYQEDEYEDEAHY